MLFWGPVSDRYGRRSAVLAGLVVFVDRRARSASCAPSLGWLIVGRGVQAFGTATGIVVSRAIVSDRYPFDRMARTLAQLDDGGRPGQRAGTGRRRLPRIAVRLALDLRRAAGRRRHSSRISSGSGCRRRARRRRPPPRPREMLRGRDDTAADAAVRRPACCRAAAVYAIFLVFISLTPYVMVSALGRSPTEYGMYYLLIALGYFFGNWSVGRWMTLARAALDDRRAASCCSWPARAALLLFARRASAPAEDLRADGRAHLRPGSVTAQRDGDRGQPGARSTRASRRACSASCSRSSARSACSAMGIFPTDTALPMLSSVQPPVCAAGMVALLAAAAFRGHAASRAGAGVSSRHRAEPAHDAIPRHSRLTITASAPRVGVLLVNLGTPDAPTVRRRCGSYLAEFLSDPRVIEMPRALVVAGPARRHPAHPAASQRPRVPEDLDAGGLAAAGRFDARSTRGLARLRSRPRSATASRVELAMTYGQPSIALGARAAAADATCNACSCCRCTRSIRRRRPAAIFDLVTRELSRWRWIPELRFVNQYYDERRVSRGGGGQHRARIGRRTAASTCCFRSTRSRSGTSLPAIRTTATATATARGVAAAPRSRRRTTGRVSFQSRFGREEWLQPYTDAMLLRRARAGRASRHASSARASRPIVSRRSRRSHCGTRDAFLAAGGDEFDYVPCLNDESGSRVGAGAGRAAATAAAGRNSRRRAGSSTSPGVRERALALGAPR